MSVEDYKLIEEIAVNDAVVLEEKGKTYGSSWRRRGGVGAFMMLCRKWDRIENICEGSGWDIFKVGVKNTGDILDDIADLRRYLLLVEAQVIGIKSPHAPGSLIPTDKINECEIDTSVPGKRYINPDNCNS